jgi:hypothetical protein
MLRAIELHLSPFVVAVVPADVDVVRGPFLVGPAWAANRRVAHLHALHLHVHDAPPPKDADRPAFSFQTVTWPIAPGTSSFVLPPALVGDLLEVEAPLGYLARQGDHYYLDGNTIRFFRAPTGPGHVLARVRTAAASGHARRGAATLSLDVNVYGRDPSTTDPMFEDVLQVVLVQLQSAPYFALQSVPGLGTMVRFSDHRTHLLHIERKLAGYENVIVCAARLELVGELDLLVATGAPPPVDLIERIEAAVAVEDEDDEVGAPLEIHIEDPDGA